MGKPSQVQIGGPDPRASDNQSGGGGATLRRRCAAGASAVCRTFSLRCFVALLLGACLLLPAIFWLPPFRVRHTEFGADDPDCFSAEIQASFILQKPLSLLVSNAGRLEYDIFEEIGVPYTKVSVISMQSLDAKDSTYVVFGVLRDPKNASISSAALSVLRSSLIGLVLQQLNLSLTPSIFGHPSSFEVLRFPGGITVVPPQTASMLERTQALFNFKLNNSIDMILKNLNQLNDELKFGLNLRSYENVYVQMTNWNGSTVAPPVTIQASVLSDVGSGHLLPDRLKQLAVVINETHPRNFGLNHSVFGKVKEVHLSSYLKYISLAPSPTPTPNPSPSPTQAPSLSQSPSPSPSSLPLSQPPPSSPSPSPLNDDPYSVPPVPSTPTYSPFASAPHGSHHSHSPCLYCHTPSPSESPSPYASTPENGPQPPTCSSGPIGSNHVSARCFSPAPNTVPVPSPPAPSDYSPHLPSPSQGKAYGLTPELAPAYSPLSPGASYSSRPVEENGRGKMSMSPMPTSPAISPSSISHASPSSFLEIRLFGYLGVLMFYLLGGLYFHL